MMGSILNPQSAAELTEKVVNDLEVHPDINLAWTAFRARILSQEQVFHALRDRRTRFQKFWDSVVGQFFDAGNIDDDTF